jgi:hypothetical protein
MYEFAGWSGGGCNGPGNCSILLTSDTAITATFNPLPLVRLMGSGTSYLSLSSALAADVGDNSEFKVRNVTLREDVTVNKNVVLNGGFADDFMTVNGYSHLQGMLLVKLGSLTVRNLVIQ